MSENEIATVRWAKIAEQIRHGKQPNRCDLIDKYLELTNALCKKQPLSQQQLIHTKVFKLLLNTMSDSLVVEHWRLLCLNNLYKPLFALKRLAQSKADKAHVDMLLQEYARMSHYSFN